MNIGMHLPPTCRYKALYPSPCLFTASRHGEYRVAWGTGGWVDSVTGDPGADLVGCHSSHHWEVISGSVCLYMCSRETQRPEAVSNGAGLVLKGRHIHYHCLSVSLSQEEDLYIPIRVFIIALMSLNLGQSPPPPAPKVGKSPKLRDPGHKVAFWTLYPIDNVVQCVTNSLYNLP